jgi:Guanine nucleotide exchange factor synembryn
LYGFSSQFGIVVQREAKRCLANALLLNPETRKIFVQVNGLDKYMDAFKARTERNGGDDFLMARIGFLLTALKDDIVEQLTNDFQILNVIYTVSMVNLLLTD